MVALALFFLTFVLVLVAVGHIELPRHQPLSKRNVPSDFPVIIMSRPNADETYKPVVLPYEALDSYTRRDYQYTFLIPQNYLSIINKLLSNPFSGSHMYGRFRGETANVQIEKIYDEKQFIRVEIGESKIVGWYIAERDKIKPTYYTKISRSAAWKAIKISLFITLCIWLVIVVFAHIYRFLQRSNLHR